MMRRMVAPLLMLAAVAAAACARPLVVARPEARTVESVVAALGPAVRARLLPYVRYAGLDYPPRELALLAFKAERRLEVWGRADGRWARIDAYPILAASGGRGPKLREGDGQVPEGIYAIAALNPNSRFHLSMMLDYPNAYDLAEAERAARTDLGGEIFIHGGAVSNGCLAMGDRTIESLFVLVADVGMEHVQVIVAPRDPRGGIGLTPVPGLPFTDELYRQIEEALRWFLAQPSLSGARQRPTARREQYEARPLRRPAARHTPFGEDEEAQDRCGERQYKGRRPSSGSIVNQRERTPS